MRVATDGDLVGELRLTTEGETPQGIELAINQRWVFLLVGKRGRVMVVTNSRRGN